MASLLARLPTILVLCVLLGIFLSLRRHAKSGSVRLWTISWSLILLHFIAQVFEFYPGWRGQVFNALDLVGLELSGTVLIASTTKVLVESRRWRQIFFAVVGLPICIHACLYAPSIEVRWIQILCFALIFFGGPLVFAFSHWPIAGWKWSLVAFCYAIGMWAIYGAFRHLYDNSDTAILAIVFWLPAIGFYRLYRRSSPGVLSTIVGFITWGAVFPLGALTDYLLPKVAINPEMWNVPKFFVAFGMILTLLEDKSLSLEEVNQREHEANQQVQNLAQITSRLLMGADPGQMCQESAEVITRYGNFRRVAIMLADDDGHLHVAGYGGLLPKHGHELEQKAPNWTTIETAELVGAGRPIGANSFHLTYEQVAKYGPVGGGHDYAPNPYWKTGDKVFVPLRSPSGRYVGSIFLDDPRDVSRVTAEELSKIELLAADLAVSLENKTLQRQLVRSEKLAAIGKLVSGVAHELNNPLTSISGFAELLLDEASLHKDARSKIEKISRESRRMQRIIDNLLRFARRKTVEYAPIDLELLLRDAVGLYEYRLRSQNINLQIKVDPTLPKVVGDEDQMKQVFVNLLSNAVDALAGCDAQRITVEMFPRSEKVVVRFADSGAGFSDPNRAFDPFYTTKPVGKGSGLGLSICYGLIKEHGGEISVQNLQPTGAAITIELPRTQKRPLTAAAAVGSST